MSSPCRAGDHQARAAAGGAFYSCRIVSGVAVPPAGGVPLPRARRRVLSPAPGAASAVGGAQRGAALPFPRGCLHARKQPPYTVFRLVCARLRIALVAAGGRIRRGGGCFRCGQAPEQHHLTDLLVPLCGSLRLSSGLFYAHNRYYTQMHLNIRAICV